LYKAILLSFSMSVFGRSYMQKLALLDADVNARTCRRRNSNMQTHDPRLRYLKNYQYGGRKLWNKEYRNFGFDTLKLKHLFGICKTEKIFFILIFQLIFSYNYCRSHR